MARPALGRWSAALVAAAVALAMLTPAATSQPITAGSPGRGQNRSALQPSAATCRAQRPSRWAPATGSTNPRGDLRVVGVQWKQRPGAVRSYGSFRTAMGCLVHDFVLPEERPGEPTLAVFNEDIGLMTLAVGRRGAAVRKEDRGPTSAPAGDQEPVSAAAALGQLNAAYAPQVAAYQAKFGPIDPRKQVFVAATDTMVRAFTRTFSRLARRYGIYVVASNNMARYHASTSPADVAVFRDPAVSHGPAYVANSQRVTNSTFLWGPRTVHPHAAPGERNLLFTNEKVPLTSLESTLLDLDPGPSHGRAARANARGAVVAGHRLGFATSLPAFAYGYPFGRRPAHFRPCRNLSVSYMACMNRLGVDTVIQAEANPGRWPANGGGGYWQPLEWMASAWRAVADPTVGFRYAVNPMMVGNLFDLPFDGQSAILARGAHRTPRHYVGNGSRRSSDPIAAGVYAGDKRQFLALAPWVVGGRSRARLRAEGARLAPGSGSPQENHYLETAVYADLKPARSHR